MVNEILIGIIFFFITFITLMWMGGVGISKGAEELEDDDL
jgi:hypothetical protein